MKNFSHINKNRDNRNADYYVHENVNIRELKFDSSIYQLTILQIAIHMNYRGTNRLRCKRQEQKKFETFLKYIICDV